MQQATGISFFFFTCRRSTNVRRNFMFRFGKGIHGIDIRTKIIRKNADIFQIFFFHSIRTCTFPSRLKQANTRLAFKKGDKNLKENYKPVSILPNIGTYLSSSYSNKFLNLQNLSSRNNSVNFEKATTRNIVFYPCLINGN